MSDLPSITPAASVPEWHPPTTKLASKPIRRREKVQLSCVLCRQKKLKCDRRQPCRSCSGRGLANSCTYVAPGTHSQRQPQSSPSNIQNKINQLEGLVISLMSTLNANKQEEQQQAAYVESTASGYVAVKEQASTPQPDADDSNLSESIGKISLDNAETTYVDSAHWTAILDGIAELKDHFEDIDSQSPSPSIEVPNNDPQGPELLFGCKNYATKEEILSVMPARPVVDRLVSRYFNAMDMAPAVVHSPTFLKEYERFWNNPSGTPIMWIGLLFTMMCLAIQFQHLSRDDIGVIYQSSNHPQDPETLLQLYREKIVQCLLLGKYTKSVPYTIQTLLLYWTGEHFRNADMHVPSWILLGIIIRIAMKSGYHRDAIHFPQISPFHGEIRRRVWAMLVQVDLATSTANGLPRMVHDGEADTAEPTHLADEDFGEDTVVMPPARPLTALTPIMYIVVKNRLLKVLAQISDLNSTTRSPSYAEVMRLDKLLHQTRAEIPEGLQMQTGVSTIILKPEVMMRRIYLAIICHRTFCTLHRNYLVPARTDPQYTYSRNTCINSALELLKFQVLMHEETQAGGFMYSDRWKVSALIMHDYLIACTILCLDLDCGLKLMREETKEERELRQTIENALLQSYKIWLTKCGESREAQKGSEAIRIILGKVQRERISGQGPSDLSSGKSPLDIKRDVILKQNLGNHSIPAASSQNTVYDASIPDDFDPTANGLGWENWDTHFQGQEDLNELLNADYGLGEFDETMWMDVKM